MSPGIDEPVIRARRIEVVDSDGRTRVIVGDLGHVGAEPEQVFGVALLDPDGRSRAWLSVDAHGAGLAFDRSGNTVLEVGVHDGGEAVRTGAFVHFSDDEGRPSLDWHVDDDGAVQLQVRGRAP